MTQRMGPGAHEQPFEDSGPRSGPPDALVLDIGGDIGALVLLADEACLGAEVDVTPAGEPRSHHQHTMIRRRRATNRDVVAGLYPELREGVYTIWGLDDSGPLGEVTIVGGRVSEFNGGNCRGTGGAATESASPREADGGVSQMEAEAVRGDHEHVPPSRKVLGNEGSERVGSSS